MKRDGSKMVVIAFNGLITVILGSIVLQSGMNGLFTGGDQWIVGLGCIVFGLLGVYYSNLFQSALGRSAKADKPK